MKATVLILVFLTVSSFAEDLYVEETGENEIIPIEETEIHKIVKRQKGDYSYDDDEDYTDFESSGDEGLYDLDTYDDEDQYEAGQPVMPSRVIPPLISPSFDDYGNVVSTPIVLSKSALDVLKTSLYIEDDLEGSGNDDFASTIVATKASTLITPEATLMPTFTTDLDEDVITATSPKLPAINQAPFVQKKLRKFAVTAGRSLRIQIPEETFFDMEDGNTRQLRVDILQEDGTPLRIPWLKYDPTIQTIFALPFDENGIGRYTFKIVATDSQGSSTFDLLEIVVRQYSGARLVNHEFTVEFSFTNWRPETTKGWEWHMLDKIRQLYGDSSPENILVRQIGENPWVFSWTNDSLTQQTCPKTDIRGLFAQLVEGEDAAYKSMFGSASSRLKALLGDEIYIKSVAMKYLGTCLMDDTIYRNQDNTGGSNPGQEDSVPVIRNPIDTINVTAGELLRYKVPEDTCYDQEDGKTSRLNLHLLTTNRRELSPEAWLQFDGKNQEFVGIPLEEEVGREEYQLVCSDANGLSAIDGIQVVVINRPFNERFGVEFSLQFGHKDYGGVGMDGFALGQPILRPDMKVSIVESLANYFGDGSTRNIILRVFDADNGQLVWHNKSLAQLPCDAPQVLWVKNHLLDAQGKVVKALIRHFQPYLKLVDANAIKQGQCITGAIPPVPTQGTPEGGSGSGRGDHTIFHGIIPSADYLLTFIIPAVIITCMLILAILLACMLHKKRKAGKLNLFYSEALPPRVPVILQDELFDDPDLGGGGHKQPVLLREDLMNNTGNGLMQSRSSQENETLLHQHQRPIQIDPYGRGSSLGRPTPAYQRRQL